MIVLMPLWKKIHTVPYLEGFISGEEPLRGQGYGKTFMYIFPHTLKSIHFTSYRRVGLDIHFHNGNSQIPFQNEDKIIVQQGFLHFISFLVD